MLLFTSTLISFEPLRTTFTEEDIFEWIDRHFRQLKIWFLSFWHENRKNFIRWWCHWQCERTILTARSSRVWLAELRIRHDTEAWSSEKSIIKDSDENSVFNSNKHVKLDHMSTSEAAEKALDTLHIIAQTFAHLKNVMKSKTTKIMMSKLSKVEWSYLSAWESRFPKSRT